MTQEVTLSLISEVGIFLAAVVAAFFSWLSVHKVKTVHLLINSRLSELLETTRLAATASATLAANEAERKRTAQAASVAPVPPLEVAK